MKDPIERQDAIDAINAVPDGNWAGKRYVAAIKELPSAQPEPCEDAEFWRKRAEYYSKMCLDLIADMNKGAKIDSIEINEEGIKFKKTQPEPIRLQLDHELSKEEYERLKKECAEQPIILLPKESAHPEIIHCHDCKYGTHGGCGDRYICTVSPELRTEHEGDFYCGYAER